jgi:predicted Zn-dependent protease with MMP-like domain
MTQDEREFFDEHLDSVMASMPQHVHELLNKVPMFVEDYPSDDVMRKMGIRRREQLCGLYTGIPLTDRSVMQSGVLSDVIHIYREGILLMASDGHGHVNESYLREQIRITVLHELGHHHGLDEDDLRELGYG